MTREAFLTTRWSLVTVAGGEGEQARAALEQLCADSWYPLYAYVRRCGVRAEDAQDVVQGFFARLIERRDLARLTPEAGRFRHFLQACVRNHLAGWREHNRAQKRGGGAVHVPLDFAAAGERYGRELALEEAPERTFDRLWALELLERCVADLEAEYRASGRAELFAALRGTLQGEAPQHSEVAARLGMGEGAVRVAIHRLRQRFGKQLRTRIAATVGSPEEVEAELQELLKALGP